MMMGDKQGFPGMINLENHGYHGRVIDNLKEGDILRDGTGLVGK